MLVSDVVSRTREVLIGFDLRFTLDAVAFRELSDEQETLVERIVTEVNQGYPLPGDATAPVAVGAYVESYAAPAAAWRIRNLRLTRTVGDPTDIQIVGPSFRSGVPPVWPSAFVKGTDIYPVDGVYDGLVGSRTYGWESALSIEVDHVTEPVDLTALGNTMAAPDDARSYLGYWLAVMFATRGHVSDSQVAQIRGRRDRELANLLSTVRDYPGRRIYSDA